MKHDANDANCATSGGPTSTPPLLMGLPPPTGTICLICLVPPIMNV